MLSELTITRSLSARMLFFASAAITTAILWWGNGLAHLASTRGLSPIFFYLFTKHDIPEASAMLVILIAAALVPRQTRLLSYLRWAGDNIYTLAAGYGLILCAGALFIYGNHPLSMDEYAIYFQSQAFAAGHLAGQVPPELVDWLIPKGFQNYFLNVSHATGEVAGTYWPSYALLLTPFSWLGIPWACNPLLSACTLVAIHKLTLKVFGRGETAGLAVLFTMASPEFFADGISYYSMTAHLLANACFALLLIEATPRNAMLAGLVGSIALTLHNPVPHMLFALPWIAWLASRPGGLRLLGCLLCGYMPLCLILGVGWFWFSYELIHQSVALTTHANILSSVPSPFALPSIALLLARSIALAKIWLWSVPGLLLLAGLGAYRYRHISACRLLLASATLTFFGYLFVPLDQGHGWGFRYFHSAWLALPILAAGVLFPPSGAEVGPRYFQDLDTQAFVFACLALTAIFGIGQRCMQIHELVLEITSQQPRYAGTERHIELIDTRFSFYGNDLVQNHPLLRGNVIRMLSRGAAEDASMMHAYYPNLRRVFADRYGSVWSGGNAKYPPIGDLPPRRLKSVVVSPQG